MSDSSSSDSNRRDFFRINNAAYVRWFKAGRPETQPSGHADMSQLNQMMQALYHHERDLSRILSSVSERDHPMTGALRILNRKLELMARMLVLSETRQLHEKPKDVSLSEGGIAFVCEQSLKKNESVSLDILLLPELLPLCLHGQVLDTEPCPGGYWTRFRFHNLSTEQQDLLARHILKAQQLARRHSEDGANSPL